MMLLVIALLATVTFDGILETPLWAYVDIAIIDTPDKSLLWTFFGFSEGGGAAFRPHHRTCNVHIAVYCGIFIDLQGHGVATRGK